MKEIFKPVLGYEEYFEVSNLGRIKRLSITKISTYRTRFYKEKITTGIRSVLGCMKISCTINGKASILSVHRLVLMTFDRLPKENEIAIHLNDNLIDNRLENLKWEQNEKRKLKTEQVVDIKKRIRNNELPSKIANMYGVTAHCIHAIKRGESWQYIN